MSRRTHSSYKRYNRKEKIRERKPLIIIGAVVLALLLTAGALIFIRYKQQQEVVYYGELDECTLPTLSMLFHDREVNRIYGYTREMDLQYLRDYIYIMDRDYDVPIQARLYGNTIKSIGFSLYDIENQNLIQKEEGVSFDLPGGDLLTATLRIDNMIEADREYSMDITMTDIDNREIHFYCRLMYNSTSPLTEMIDLTMEHHDAMYGKPRVEFLADYQEPNSAVNDSTNLGSISLSSTVNSMYWGTMGVHIITEPVLNIVDLDTDVSFFRMNYQVGRTNDLGIDEYYNVSEYYRTRVYGDRKFILSYDRRVNQIFVPDSSFIGNKSVMVGIEENLDIPTMTNAAGNINVFVASKAIWQMDTDTKTLQKIFSFETSPTDIRQNHDEHDIKLLKITDSGDLQFLVYGYMNRGMHEGQTGIGLYTYSAQNNEVQEDIFIPSYLPYQVLKNSIGSLCYLNDKGLLYILLDEFIYVLDPNSNKATLFASGLNDNNFKASVSGRMIAWQEGGAINTATRIHVYDLEDETTYYVTAEEGRNIKVLGFLDRDLVYGAGDSGHIHVTADGIEYLMMDDLYVVNRNNQVQTSEHSSSGYFITSLVEYNRVVVNRIARVGNEYKKGDEFTLFSTDLESRPQTSVYNTYDEDRRTVNYIEVVNVMESNRPAQINDQMKITLCSAETTDVGDMIADNGKYYVYAAGEIEDIMTNPSEAIMKAYYATGVVVTENGYFYKRTSRPLTVELTRSSIDHAVQAWKDETALNITGIYLRQALYYTGRKIPVIWEWEEDTYIIYGYDLFDNLMLYDVRTGEELLMAYDDIDVIFDETGRCFIDWQ